MTGDKYEAKARKLVARWVSTLGMAWRHSANSMSTESDMAAALREAAAEEREAYANIACQSRHVIGCWENALSGGCRIAFHIRARGGRGGK